MGRVQSIEGFVSKFLESQHFKSLGPFSERHGAWEITFHKSPQPEEKLDRFVVLALVEMPTVPSSATSYDIEVWTGAEDGTRFVRRFIAGFRASAGEFRSEAFEKTVKEKLERAVEVAKQITPADLTEAYLPTRSSR